MKNKRTVINIPTTSKVINNGTIIKKKVCVYARVSTLKELQKSSFELQISTYYNQINKNPYWEFAGVFADYGKSGTNVIYRTEFNKMIELARLGKIDIILTKSVSRFTRDTVDGLKIIQELRMLGVEVIFEKENISTNDTAFDFFLTIYTSVAEEESKINSSNVLWKYQKKMKQGGNTTSRLYGYTFDECGDYIINEPEADAVRLIFKLYLEGKTMKGIITELKIKGYKSATGKDTFPLNSLKDILTNEKYAGDMLLQKTTVIDVGSRRSKKNLTKPKYYVSNNHEPIIKKEDFLKVQEIRKERDRKYNKNHNVSKNHKYHNYIYSDIAKRFYRTKINHRNTKYEVKLLEMLDSNGNRILEAKNIYYKQVDKAIEEATKALIKDLRYLKDTFNQELNNKIKDSNLLLKIENTTNIINNLKDELKTVKASSIDAGLKDNLKSKLNEDLAIANADLIKLKHLKLMRYDYEKNVPILIKKLRDLSNNEDVCFKDIFKFIIAKSRENLILCIHLSNRNIADVNLDEEIDNESLYRGSFLYKQSRVLLDTVWSIIVL